METADSQPFQLRCADERCNLDVSGGGSGLKADLRLDGPGGPRVATKPKPVEDGGARLLVGDDALEGKAVTAVLVDGNDRVIAQRRTVVGLHT